MSSLVPGYEYDIFISYRQKDNKYDGWVTEFVDNLRRELEATFKEDISIYFDINPNDGLLENHNVNESLKNKLKCLVFIPIISRIYCDPRSFAWEYEFKAFVNQASLEPAGLKVRLSNGNVAGRVLPVRIYDLDPEDIKLCESVTGEVFRGIDFIFKAPGVNRPLRMKEENPQENLNHTHYRDQVNKVANAIKELIQALSHPGEKLEKAAAGPGKPYLVSKTGKRPVFLKWLLLSLFIAAAGIAIMFYRNGSGEKTEKSIAVLPFKLLSDEAGKQYLADGMMDAILLHLQKFNDLKVRSRTSVEQYRDTRKTVGAISKELNARYLLEGSLQKQGEDMKLIVQLIESNKDKHLWAEEYSIEWKEVFTVQSEVAKAIAEEMHMQINPEEKALIEKVPTKNMEAYDLYIKGLGSYNEYEISRQLESYNASLGYFKSSIALDTTFSKVYVGLAKLYISRYYWESYFKEDFIDTCTVLIDKAILYNPEEEEAYFLRGKFKLFHGKFSEAIADYDKTLGINPNYSDAYYYKGLILTTNLHDFAKGIMNYERALELIYGEQRPVLMRRLGRSYQDAGFVEKARSIYNAAFLLDGNSKAYYSDLIWLETSSGNFTEAVRLTKKTMEIDSTYTTDLFILSMVPGYEKEAYRLAERIIQDNKREGAVSLIGTHRIGYAFYKAGYTEESKKFFEQQIRYGLDQIKLNRPLAQRRQAHYDLAATYAFMGEKEKAYSYLDEVRKLDFFPLWWVTLAKNDPLFEGIRKEKRFMSFLEDMEAKHMKEHEKLGEWIEKNEKK